MTGAGGVAAWPGSRVVVRLPNWVGDAVMALPSILALGEAYPEAEWLLLGGPRSGPLFEGLDEPFRLLPPLPTRASRPGPFLQGVSSLRHEDAAAALLLPPSFSSVAMAAAAGIPIRVGFPGDARSPLLTRPGETVSRSRHLRAQYHRLAALFLECLAPGRAFPPVDPEPARIPLRPGEIDGAERWFQEHGLDPARAIALAPGATYGPTKRWPLDRFGALARDLRADGREVLWIGGAEEADACHALVAGAGGGVVAAGVTTLRETVALLARVRAVIANDSGAAHLAQGAGAPVVVIFGSTAPEWTGPVGSRAAVVREPVPCAPCFSPTCPTKVECLDGISVPRVRTALEALLARTADAPGRPALFLDRDGVLLDLVHYLRDPAEVRLAPGAGRALRRLRDAAIPFVVVTNQSAVARGLLDRAGLFRVHQRVRELLAAEGVHPLAIEFCPHHPENGGPCDCRKPAPGMLRRAAHRFALDLPRSGMVGDSPSDLEAGRRAGCRTILVRTGYGPRTEEALRIGEDGREPGERHPDLPWKIVDDLGAAVDAFLAGA